MSAAISFIATLTCSGTASTLVSNVVLWYFLVTAVPCLVGSWRNTRDLPSGRPQAGDRHLNFHESRDNLVVAAYWMLKRDEPYQDLGADWHSRRNTEAHTRRLIAQLEHLGHHVTITPAA
jgi:hypothetical protein